MAQVMRNSRKIAISKLANLRLIDSYGLVVVPNILGTENICSKMSARRR